MTLDPRTILAVTAALRDLPDLVERLSAEELARATPEPGGSKGKPTSRPPVNITPISDVDETWNGLTAWVHDWMDVLDLAGPQRWTWPGVTRWLGAQWENAVAKHPAADDFASDLLHRHNADCPRGCSVGWVVALRRHEGIAQRSWRPMLGRWACPISLEDGDCLGRLLEHASERIIRCDRCGATWEGEAEYEQLGRLLGCETTVTIDQAAVIARSHRRTIVRWIDSGILPTILLPDGKAGVDKRDLALVIARRVGA